MSSIIRSTATADGIYLVETQSHREYPANWNGDGWLAVPPDLEDRLDELGVRARPIIKDGVIVALEENDVELVEPERLPSPTEQLRADVDYIAAMTEVNLG